jgi:hypothetical protein
MWVAEMAGGPAANGTVVLIIIGAAVTLIVLIVVTVAVRSLLGHGQERRRMDDLRRWAQANGWTVAVPGGKTPSWSMSGPLGARGARSRGWAA